MFLQVAGETPVPLPAPTTSQWADPITAATVVIAFFTVASVIVSALMWSAARKQAQITEKMFEAAHRPYIGVEKVEGSFNHHNSQVDLSVYVYFRNSGEVPALEIHTTWQVSIKGEVLEPTNPKGYPKILPRDSQTYSYVSFSLSAETYKAYKESQLDIFAAINYKGVTEKEYTYEQHATCDDVRGFIMTRARST